VRFVQQDPASAQDTMSDGWVSVTGWRLCPHALQSARCGGSVRTRSASEQADQEVFLHEAQALAHVWVSG